MTRFVETLVDLYPGFDPAAWFEAETLVELAHAEDLGTPLPGFRFDPESHATLPVFSPASGRGRDVTAEGTIPASARGSALFVARKPGVVAGLPLAHLTAWRFGLADGFRPLIRDGERVGPGTAVASVEGPMRELLMMERTALNFLQRLGGIATLTARFVDEAAGTKAKILDTRKTTAGWRALEKYAVRCGGGVNHRFGLYDQVLIKDNHLAWIAQRGESDPVVAAVQAARNEVAPSVLVEVEVDTLDQLDRALSCRPDVILVDNLGRDQLAEAVRRRDAAAPQVLLEASGGINLETVAGLARTGVDRISVGALTHSAPALDIGLDFDPTVSP
ncbi:MAG: carboxylating nicotinate-nucleotide diphosphorylase [Isosphaeraceae bacterium]